jgi:membrane fusion protein, copper/silver efflux system
MRSVVAVIAVSIGFAGALACSRPAGDVAQSSAEAKAAARFHCPMHPSIVQDHPGDCPVCNMKLVPTEPAVKVAAAAAPQAAARYHCPMHPSIVQDHPGDCPVCNMKLVPVDAPKAAAAPAALSISAEKQKVIGMRVTAVQTTRTTRSLRVVGRVVPDEGRIYKVNAGLNGSFKEVFPFTTGSRVKKGDVLASVYGPDALSAIQLFIVNTQGYDRMKQQKFHPDGTPEGEGKGEDEVDTSRRNSGLYKANLQQRIMQLENFGVSEPQRDEIARTGKVPDAIRIVSPANGFVLSRNASASQKFERGVELYTIADLSKVWVLADVFQQDVKHVRAGMRAQVSIPEQQVKLPAVVTEILPQFDAAARTLKVKVVVDNPGMALRPDMFVDVNLGVALPEAVAIPADAIVDTGLAKTVYVQTSEDVFEPRRVETGWRSGDQVQIVSGLAPGEKIVTSGTFFLDSETRMRAPVREAAAAGTQARQQ